MTFTDANPAFPYQSSEAARQLGIPDSPEIHLAITRLADSLIPLAAGASLSDSDVRIAALRTASGGVLFSYPFDLVVIRFHASLGLPVDQDAIDAAANLERTDWLGQAARDLKAKGVKVQPNFRQQSSHYGWQKMQ